MIRPHPTRAGTAPPAACSPAGCANPLTWLNQPEPAQVRALIAQIAAPHCVPVTPGVDPNDFYAVACRSNQSRVVLRDWLEAPVDQVQRVGEWFAEHQIADLWEDGPQMAPLWPITRSAGQRGTHRTGTSESHWTGYCGTLLLYAACKARSD